MASTSFRAEARSALFGMEETVPAKWTCSGLQSGKDGKAHGPYLYWGKVKKVVL